MQGHVLCYFPEDDTYYELEQGDALLIPPATGHKLFNIGDEDALISWSCCPSSLTAIVRTQIALCALRAKINLLFFERKYIKMSKHPELIVMLTHNDRTVENAYEIFDACKDTKAKYWGFKEVGIPLDEMKKLCSYMKACGKTTFLEVVAYTEEECLAGAKMAVEVRL